MTTLEQKITKWYLDHGFTEAAKHVGKFIKIHSAKVLMARLEAGTKFEPLCETKHYRPHELRKIERINNEKHQSQRSRRKTGNYSGYLRQGTKKRTQKQKREE